MADDNISFNINGDASGGVQAVHEFSSAFLKEFGDVDTAIKRINTALESYNKTLGNLKKIPKLSQSSFKNNDNLQLEAANYWQISKAIVDLTDKEEQLVAKRQQGKITVEAYREALRKLTDERRKLTKEEQTALKNINRLATGMDKTAESAERLAASTHKFVRGLGVTTSLYAISRLASEINKLAEANERLNEASGGKAGNTVFGLDTGTVSRWASFIQDVGIYAAAGAQIGAQIGGGKGAIIGGVLGGTAGGTTNIIGYDTKWKSEAWQKTTEFENQERTRTFTKMYQNVVDTYTNMLSGLNDSITSDEAKGIFANAKNWLETKNRGFTNEFVTQQISDLDVRRGNLITEMNSLRPKESKADFEKYTELGREVDAIDAERTLLANFRQAMTNIDKKVETYLKQKAEAEEKERQAKAKRELEEARRAEKERLNAEKKAAIASLRDQKETANDRLKKLNEEESEETSRRNERISSIESTRDSITTSFSKAGGSVGPQFAALSKVLVNEQASLRKYQETMKRTGQTIINVIKDIDSKIDARQNTPAVLG